MTHPALPPFFLRNISLLFFIVLATATNAQMRKMYVDNNADNHLKRSSFFTASKGYVAFDQWIGFTQDSGRSFIQRYIQYSNVDFNGFNNVNLTFGFGISGVKAFNADTLIVYGHYGFVPAILYSTNGGSTFKLIYHTYWNAQRFTLGVTDMIFPGNSNIGYAVEFDRIIKTTDRGKSWKEIKYEPNSFYDRLEAPDDNNVIAMSTEPRDSKLIKSNNGGLSWEKLNLPEGYVNYSFFVNEQNGWISMRDPYRFYYTTDGGSSWTAPNIFSKYIPYDKFKFLNSSTGYALYGNHILKTTDSGKVWERLPRDNDFQYLNFGHQDLHFFSSDHFWAGGGHGLLEMTTNAGGTPIPSAQFQIDTSGLSITKDVKLINHAKPGDQYEWYKNGQLISTSYHTTYKHTIGNDVDLIMLVVKRGTISDSASDRQYFVVPPPLPIPVITSFSPDSASPGTVVTITGTNFTGTKAVLFGGKPASSFVVVNSTTINAIVGASVSGDIAVTNEYGTATKSGFTYLPPPAILSFSPAIADVGTVVTISGINFSNVTSVKFGGIPALSFTIISPTVISAVVGTGGSGSVQVTSAYGSSAKDGFSFIPRPPVINSFSPLSAAPNSTVKILGNNFSNIATENTVYFGAVKATIISAADNLLNVIVPSGASNDYITVSVRNLTAFSPIPFVATFEGIGVIDSSSFSSKHLFEMGEFPRQIAIVDIDLDGKPDVAAANSWTSDLRILKNNSDSGNISFNPAMLFQLGTSLTGIKFADLDGDGKKDFIGCNFYQHNIVIWKNNSNPGEISFGSKLNINTTRFPSLTEVSDLDGDGKPDIIMSYDDGDDLTHTISVLRNTSIGNEISFAPRIDIAGAGTLTFVSDFNDDKKPDLIVIGNGGIDNSVFRIYLNTSTVANISFAPFVSFAPENFNDRVCIGDVDGDHKADIITTNYSYNRLSIFRNTSTTEKLSFASAVQYHANLNAHVTVGDVDGDSKPDIFTTSQANITALYKNNSTPGTISFADKLDIPLGGSPGHAVIGDLDGDKRPEIVFGLSIGIGLQYTLAVIQNQVPFGAEQLTICASGSSKINSHLSGTAFQWQQNSGSGFVNISDNNNFAGTKTAILEIKNPPISWNDYQYRCITGAVTSKVFRTNISAATDLTISLSTPSLTVCGGQPVTFTATASHPNTIYTWLLNGYELPNNFSNTLTLNNFSNNSQISVKATTISTCVASNSAESNTLLMTVKDPVRPEVRITSTNPNVCSGGTITFTAEPVNAGATPKFQWMVIGQTVETNSNTYTYTAPLNSGGISSVYLQMTSSEVCAIPPVVTSNTINISYSESVQPTVKIATSSPSTICAGTNVTFTASTDREVFNAIYQWKKNGQNVGSNSEIFSTSDIANGDIISLILTSDSQCMLSNTSTSNSITMNVSGTLVTPSVAITASSVNICQNETVTFTATPTHGGSNPIYLWQKNGVNIGTNSSILSTSDLSNNDIINVMMKSNAGCLVTENVFSNDISISVSPKLTPAVTLSGNTVVNAGQSVTITATATNGGSDPIYQWQDSTNTHTWRNIANAIGAIINYTPADGNKVRLQLTSNAGCVTVAGITSQPLVFTVNSPGIVNPNPVEGTLQVRGLNLADNWQTLEIHNISTGKKMIIQSVVGQTQVSVDVTRLSPGLHVMILKNSEGKTHQMKFVKL